MFDTPLEELINRKHSLIVLSKMIPWGVVCEPLEKQFSEGSGRPALPARLVVGSLYLKSMYDLSDEEFVSRWVENPYWQYFCGEEYFRYDFPFNPSSLSKWRKRFSDEDLRNVLKVSVQSLEKGGLLTEKEAETVNVDTTVQEKNIEFPTDRKTLFRVLIQLVRQSKSCGIGLRQSYVLVAKKALRMSAVYASRKKYKISGRYERNLRNYVGRVMRDIGRKIEGIYEKQCEFEYIFGIAERAIAQSKDKKSKNKIYSLHEPHVECITKGKVHKQYEFGVKVSVVATSQKGFILSCLTAPGNPHDSATLETSLDDAIKTLGRESIRRVYVDKGYRGHGIKGPIQVTHAGQRPKDEKIKRELKRRPAIEGVISHLKGTCRMWRNFLKGQRGDTFNCIFAAAAHNFLLLIGAIYLVSGFWSFSGLFFV
jgi:transposase, IS5 family